jgi:hypothetical protein
VVKPGALIPRSIAFPAKHVGDPSTGPIKAGFDASRYIDEVRRSERIRPHHSSARSVCLGATNKLFIMAIWETEDEFGGLAASSLPTPQDTPYRTSSRSSRKARRSATPPRKGSSSPPLAPGEKSSKRSSRDISNDESISILDPRRFTPTLHASLVSEILGLRRDQEDKTKLIESLEASLHSTREEHELVEQTLLGTAKENRSLKRQLALLEGGTSSALGELARERDEAADAMTDTKKRLDSTQRKLRSQEDDNQRMHDLWAKEKDAWEEEKRKYERKVHVAESRLKVVLDEVAAYQAAHMNGAHNGADSEVEESAKENDAASVRTMSMTNSIRFSVLSGPGKQNGHSLADELNFDGDDDYQTDHDGRESVLSNNNRHMRNLSRDSMMSRLHRRNQSIESLRRPGSVARGKLFVNQSVLEILEDGIDEAREDQELEPAPAPVAPKVSYTDTGIQFSPPPSPKLQPVKPSTPEPQLRWERFAELESPPRSDLEIEANQRRKRVHIGRPLVIEPPPVVQTQMVSASSQTVDEPLSPPKTPKSPFRPLTPPPEIKVPSMVSSATQTDKPVPRPEFFPMPPLSIPSISIHPPTSRPTTPREPRLPQYFKDFGCQVSIPVNVPSQSIAVQTEEIRTDKRLAQLPIHLHPSTITSRPTSPAPFPEPATADDGRQFTPVPGNLPPRNPRRLTTKRSLSDIPSSPPLSFTSPETRDAYPGNNDDGPLSNEKAPMRRPHRISSLFAGFDGNSSDEADDMVDAEMSDSEFRTALTAPRPKSGMVRTTKRNSTSTTATSPEQVTNKHIENRNSVRMMGGPEIYTAFSLENKDLAMKKASLKSVSRAYEKSSTGISGNRASVMRKAAMIQSGIATHQNRSRSPSLADSREPPFPIPTRASSRKPPVSISAPSDGQRSPTRADAWHKRGSSRSHYRANSIRKVRSAAALPRNYRYRRHGSRSPPPFEASTEASEPSDLPPLPNNDITTPRNKDRHRSHQPQLSTNTANTVNTNNTINTDLGSTGSASQTTGVVDAIAQAMVGEWMFKYVRRRKSFGMPEQTSKDETSNDRHKRWVWLAPYERAILWSSKQPSSGSALMGKSGRKCKSNRSTTLPLLLVPRVRLANISTTVAIQSVLDVKDDNPAPKGFSPPFNRSILILTPQRALKFTAVSAERHYVWLTALSFLAHSSQAVPEIVPAVPIPKAVPDFDIPMTKLKKPGIRDSIRLAKGKTAFNKVGTPSIPSLPSIPSQMGDVVSFRNPGSYPNLPSLPSIPSTHQRELSREAAEPPFIPRFHERASQALVHGRKRSNTGGHVPPPLSFRGFSGPAGSAFHNSTNSTAGASIATTGSSDIYQSHTSHASHASGGNSWAISTTASQRTSEASSRPSNFFDAIGTVRMEAFISPLAFPRFDEYPDEQEEFRILARRRSKELRRRASRSRHRDSYQSRGTRGTDDFYAGSRTTVDEDYFREDPFKGF